MLTGKTQELLDALQGTHRLTSGEQLTAATRTFWLTLTLGSLALLVLMSGVSALTGVTWAEFGESSLYGFAVLTIFILAFALPFKSATATYVFDTAGLRSSFARVLRVWSIPRSDISEARIDRGMFGWYMTLSLRNQASRTLVLTKSMERALGLKGGAADDHTERSGT